MMKYKNTVLKTLLLMVFFEIGLSLLFNFLCMVRVIPKIDILYFAVLFFETLIYMCVIGAKLRSERSKQVSKAAKRRSGGSTCETMKDEANGGDNKHKNYNAKEYFITNFAAGMSFMLIVYMVRLFLGAPPFRILFAITNFAKFTGFVHNVYISLAIFCVILALVVFIAQVGVVSGKKKRSQDRKREREQRMEEALKETERVRAHNAGEVDVLGAVVKTDRSIHQQQQ